MKSFLNRGIYIWYVVFSKEEIRTFKRGLTTVNSWQTFSTKIQTRYFRFNKTKFKIPTLDLWNVPPPIPDSTNFYFHTVLHSWRHRRLIKNSTIKTALWEPVTLSTRLATFDMFWYTGVTDKRDNWIWIKNIHFFNYVLKYSLTLSKKINIYYMRN